MSTPRFLTVLTLAITAIFSNDLIVNAYDIQAIILSSALSTITAVSSLAILLGSQKENLVTVNCRVKKLIAWTSVVMAVIVMLSSLFSIPERIEETNKILYGERSAAKVFTDEFGNLVLQGPIGSSTEASFNQHVTGSHSGTLLLSSGGGLLDSAEAIAAQVEKYGLHTIVADSCSSACVLIALSGNIKGATRNAQFGFHRVTAVLDNKSERSRFTEKYGTESFLEKLRDAGIPNDILVEAKKTAGSEMYYVTSKELHSRGVIDMLID